MAAMVPPESIHFFQENGAVCLRNVFSSEWIKKVTVGIQKNLDEPSRYAESLKEGPTQGVYFNDYFNWQNIAEFKDFVYHSPAAEIVKQLLDTKTLTFYHEHVLIKEQGALKETPWHQDQSYYPFNGDKVCSIWLPVDPVPLETTLQFIKGSHKWGWFFPRKFATSANYPFLTSVKADDNNVYRDVPDVVSLNDADILQWTLQPGDCVVFHMKTLHGANGNTTSIPRRILSTRWFGDDAELAIRAWEPSPPIVGGLLIGQHPSNEASFFPRII